MSSLVSTAVKGKIRAVRKTGMAFEKYIPEAKHRYEGIFVGSKMLNVTLPVTRAMESRHFKFVDLDYDKERGLIRIAKSDTGHKFNHGIIQAKVSRVMPNGRYELISNGPKEFLFKKSV